MGAAEALLADGDGDDYARLGAEEAELYASMGTHRAIDLNPRIQTTEMYRDSRVPPTLGRITTRRAMPLSAQDYEALFLGTLPPV